MRADSAHAPMCWQVFLTPTHLAIVMEYASGGELFDRIVQAGRFVEDEARYFFQQLISGVHHCHCSVSSGRGVMLLSQFTNSCAILSFWGGDRQHADSTCCALQAAILACFNTLPQQPHLVSGFEKILPALSNSMCKILTPAPVHDL